MYQRKNDRRLVLMFTPESCILSSRHGARVWSACSSTAPLSALRVRVRVSLIKGAFVSDDLNRMLRACRSILVRQIEPMFPYDRPFYCYKCESTIHVVWPDDATNVFVNPHGDKAVLWCPGCDSLVTVTK